jgi:hypothetical protein
MDDLELLANEIKKDKEAKGVSEFKIETSNFLFLDISSACTGFSISKVDFAKRTATITKSGCIWLPTSWTHGQKYYYMFEVIQTYFEVVEQIDYMIVEQYSVNPSKMMGVNVVSEMQGAIKAAAFSNGVKVESILPQSWRSQLGIKAAKIDGKRDYKTPTKNFVNSVMTVPEEVISNITKKPRNTPSDVYDVLAINFAWCKKFNLKVISKDCEFNTHVGTLGE